MNAKSIRLLSLAALLAAAIGVSSVARAAGPNYCDPLGNCHAVKLSPSTVKAGSSTTVSGSVGNGCSKPGVVTVYSRAFKGATRHQFAGVPAISIKTNRKGKFSKRVTIRRSVKRGRYHVGARCGGGNLGSATLKVT